MSLVINSTTPANEHLTRVLETVSVHGALFSLQSINTLIKVFGHEAGMAVLAGNRELELTHLQTLAILKGVRELCELKLKAEREQLVAA